MRWICVFAWLPFTLGCPLQTSSSTTPTAGSPSSSSADRASGASDGHAVTVPDVRGKTKAEAEAAVSAAGIRGGVQIGNDQGSYDPATATVCTQNPGGGQQTSSTLFVAIRFCVADAPVVDKRPALVGVSVDEATRRVKDAGFTGTIEVLTLSEYDATCKADTVCMFTPNHWELNQDRRMTLYINSSTRP